ncbi:MAG: helix-turn-helix domain-containing protein [Candidatus Thiodiazotropha sp.]|nr:helix-turn-helix domain-containing protein [Candidatus Thiodiazotropha sp.]MCM8883215.1 helix-turn-helix domain-containing protein [Candidatus Thiodiazotropha sp.]MCM8920610.1 helix-turn-helix domain-containing protein [Candidatus Thiodiazotropha sp.]
MKINAAFGKALRRFRKTQGLSQEAFGLVSSRTYLSTLERGLKSPTLDKIEALASVLNIHPLTLLTLAYQEKHGRVDLKVLSERVSQELAALTRID